MSTPSWSSSYVSIQFVPHYIPSSLQQRSPGSTGNVIQPTKQIPTKEYLNCFTELSSSATPAEPLILTPYPFAITILYYSSQPQPLCIADLCCWLLGCLGCPSWIWCETLCPYFLCAIILVFVINSSPVLAAMTGIGNYLSFLILWLVVGGWWLDEAEPENEHQRTNWIQLANEADCGLQTITGCEKKRLRRDLLLSSSSFHCWTLFNSRHSIQCSTQ